MKQKKSTENIELSGKSIQKIEQALSKIYYGEFIIEIPLRIVVRRGNVVKIEELEIKQVKRSFI